MSCSSARTEIVASSLRRLHIRHPVVVRTETLCCRAAGAQNLHGGSARGALVQRMPEGPSTAGRARRPGLQHHDRIAALQRPFATGMSSSSVVTRRGGHYESQPAKLANPVPVTVGKKGSCANYRPDSCRTSSTGMSGTTAPRRAMAKGSSMYYLRCPPKA